MKLTYDNSAAVLVQENDTKILIDPWFCDGEYYGSWGFIRRMILDQKNLWM